VVDGSINAHDSSAHVALSRAVSLSAGNIPPAERGAMITIEDEGGTFYALPELVAGSYVGKFASAIQKKYRLHITTVDEKKYISDFVTALQSPPIDSIYWEPASDGISVLVDSHDPQGQTQYYRWTFQETWKYNSAYSPGLIVEGGQVLPYFPDFDLHTCYNSTQSSSILIYSTTTFREDRVSKFPVTFLSKISQKLSVRYSIEVTQQAISADQYNFWLQLQTTTQNLGGLFDPLPSQVIGNVHNVNDAKEPVLGYFTAGTFASMRVFIDHYDLPKSLQVLPDFSDCSLDSIPTSRIASYADGTLLIGSYGNPFTIGYLSAPIDCLDCRRQGGTTTKPVFWK
jgi:hypothetical protein